MVPGKRFCAPYELKGVSGTLTARLNVGEDDRAKML